MAACCVASPWFLRAGNEQPETEGLLCRAFGLLQALRTGVDFTSMPLQGALASACEIGAEGGRGFWNSDGWMHDPNHCAQDYNVSG